MNDLRREADRVVLKIVAAKSPVHISDIAEDTQLHPLTVDQTCVRLHGQGYLAVLGQGRYKITETGERQIRNSIHE